MASAKTALRRQVRGSLKGLEEAELLRQSSEVCERLARSETFARSRRIGLFLAMPSGELRTEGILALALLQGKQVYCPRVLSVEEARMDFYEVTSVAEAQALPLSRWKIPEPPER